MKGLSDFLISSYPVLVAVDDFQALFCRTAYRDPHYKPIASYHLQVPRLLLEITSGRRSFVNKVLPFFDYLD